MASRNSTRHGASANARRRRETSESRRGSVTRTRKAPPQRRRTTSSPRKTHAQGRRSRGGPGTGSGSGARVLRRTVRRPWRAILLGVAGLLIVGWTFYPALRIHYLESREQARLQAELERLVERNEALSDQVERLKTPEGVEELARENLGMVKQGENLYVVLGSEATATAVPEADGADADTVWVEILDRVFGAPR